MPKPNRRRDSRLRTTLRRSQHEAVASAITTATGDNFFNAFAVFLQASAAQLAMLTAVPQFIGAAAQLSSLWLARHWARKAIVVFNAVSQGISVLLIAALAISMPPGVTAVWLLIILAIFYHANANIIQPHWRAWMGGLVPAQRRGVFFASRTRLTMATSLAVFVTSGAILSVSERMHWSALGFLLIFSIAGIGRLVSARYLALMHDPDPHPVMSEPEVIKGTWHQCREAWYDQSFRRYSMFVACMQAMVAISAPFFAVYMLEFLQFSYLQFSLNIMASILVQFLSLGLWGKLCDQLGNRFAMRTSSFLLPCLPALWLFEDSFYYLFIVQMVSGLAWAGFTLSTANYLYDIRPHRSNFATYAALQAALGASMIFVGALTGGLIVAHADKLTHWLGLALSPTLLIVFAISAIMRLLVLTWFLPRIHEPHIRHRPQLLQLVFRIARFNAISGMVLDWLTVTHKASDKPKKKEPNGKLGSDENGN